MCHGQLLSESLLKARKLHHCAVCRKDIQPGEVYYRQATVDGRDFGTWKAHEKCAALAWAARDGDYDACEVDPTEAIAESAHSNWRWLRAEAKRHLAGLRQRLKRPAAIHQ